MKILNRTKIAVERQLKGMGCTIFEIGINHPSKGFMNREMDFSGIVKSIPFFKKENTEGCDLYVRPARREEGNLILLDDLTLSKIEDLQAGDFAAAVIVMTSPMNYQAWVKLDVNTGSAMRLEIARYLARQYDTDMNSADAWHYGRLAGFTNQKRKHVTEDGKQPFVLLESYNGKSCLGSDYLIRTASQLIKEQNEKLNEILTAVLPTSESKKIEYVDVAVLYDSINKSMQKNFGGNLDQSRLDWFVSLALINRGYDAFLVEDLLLMHSPGLHERKRTSAYEYTVKTAWKALVWLDFKSRGFAFKDVSNILLSEAKARRDASIVNRQQCETEAQAAQH